ncbi:MAG TPA: hypothetical protein VHW90_13695 [Stellaceae bacterium]|jgi:hypothetical protein|nr:hypothetical protein [Stellaceae bacterium]
MATCFVIQPFDDGGKFDKRYKDIFEPAIREAGLESYRVDADPGVSVPIEDIQSGIRRAAACLADITLDNPNVWFELGYALASEKQICMVCSEERTSKYPFDVQHRTIIKYRLDGVDDFSSLRKKINNRLTAIIQKEIKLAAINAQSPIKEDDGLLQHEMMALLSITENRDGPGATVRNYIVQQEMERLGYNNVAVNIGIEGLLDRQMISMVEAHDYNGEPYTTYLVEREGIGWIRRNHDRLNLQVRPVRRQQPQTKDDDIPF